MDIDLLYRHLREYLRRVGRSVARGPDVDDLVHDVFLVALTRRNPLREPALASAWLRGVALRTARSRARREARRGRIVAALDPWARDHSCDPTLDRLEASAALAAIPVAALSLWWRHVGLGESTEQIAAARGCSSSTVKRTIREVTRRLSRSPPGEAARIPSRVGPATVGPSPARHCG